MNSLPFPPSGRQQAQERLLRIKELIMQGFAYSDEKVSVASTAADVVSKHMVRLDRDFSMLEEELPSYIRDGSPPPQITTTAAAIRNAPKRVEASTPKKSAAQRAAVGAALRDETATPQPVVSRHGRQSKPRRRSVSPVSPPRATVTATVQNDEEPTYCYCNQVSYGEMVACDGDDCEREWFHLACVNLSAPPKGSWFCDACKKAPPAPKRRRGL
ncbi:Inhibitor of growth protein [Taphrina deformans PYCC 5710]|uniref:Chromatin modification-related protein n=1 Tax=Taphrina deformans (strain PYCC 5710 / ATCC 11124 / CBS 356.35 / IMI 108563 / JCM 9778 / NBRC 8474) TaxID=1097556 RepID=R4XIJ6_TAPDE|nr:Inhibitor of growth protein [Taphrina deformans PYCC 5710]|eukprot:CCG83182.1 Inhibitor of growth protein [Taphrina deformans PYCC 5710]